ncbi:DUF2238 domain-containing protein [Candidatus Woesearchaeota archaeon]|nr:DUF2238 domain-containing protein [Candidatus Woesearchaeota archaeon]
MRKKDIFPLSLLAIFILFWLFSAIAPRYREVWLAENILTIAFILFLIITYRTFRFSNWSYGLIFGFMLLHVLGSYYSYSEMPLFSYFKELFMLSRNHYDRLVHFLFGIIFFLPLQEFCRKKLHLSRGWSFLFAFMMIAALKGMYEVLEYGWLLVTKNELIGMAYLGMQGDAWDAQKDIFWGLVGAGIGWLGMIVKDVQYKKRKRE